MSAAALYRKRAAIRAAKLGATKVTIVGTKGNRTMTTKAAPGEALEALTKSWAALGFTVVTTTKQPIYDCPYCGREHDEQHAACCHEVGHVELRGETA